MSYRDGIETERLVTRFLKAEDAGIWKAFLENKEATELFPPAFRNNPEEQAVTWIERQQTRYKENRYGLQALIDKKTGTFIGQCG
ncbi:MAG: GNAT family N-acetyltransferase, partial [Bacteroidia bacterium]|nr:GNAT family N-acetyltransferase [Bacteroidia bacterium]